MIKVSIIITAYNIEDYIEQCIESIINQTMKELEIIIVDDGSSDNTIEKINKYKIKDNRIRVLEQQNKGVSVARQNGCKIASGEYILIVDGDDWLEKDICEKLYIKAKSNNYDIVTYNFKWTYEDGKYKIAEFKENSDMKEFEYLINCLCNNTTITIWSKFIRREFIAQDYGVFVHDVRYGEDLAFNCLLGIKEPYVGYLNEPGYYYFQRSNSAMKNKSSRITDVDKAITLIYDKIKENNIERNIDTEFEFMSFIHMYYYRLSSIIGTDKELSKELYRLWKKRNINIRKNKLINRYLSKKSITERILVILVDWNYNIGNILSNILRG